MWRYELYAGARDKYLRGAVTCEGCGVAFGRTEPDLHHAIGRVGSRLWDSRYFRALCRECHESCHRDRAWAIENNLILVLTAAEEAARKASLGD